MTIFYLTFSEGKEVGRGEESSPFNFATMLASPPVGLDCTPLPMNSVGTYGFDISWQPPLKPIGIGNHTGLFYLYTLQEDGGEKGIFLLIF